MEAAMATKKGRIRLVEDDGVRVLDVTIPRGATLKQVPRVIESIDAAIEKLTGCPCNSGLSVRLREHGLLDPMAKFDEQIGL